MPWTDSQVRLFAAAAHDKGIAQAHGMSQSKARGMQMEASPEQRSRAMKRQALAQALKKHRG